MMLTPIHSLGFCPKMVLRGLSADCVLAGAPAGFKLSMQKNHLRHLTPTVVIFERLSCTGLFTCILSINPQNTL